MKKRVIASILSLAIVFGLTGCISDETVKAITSTTSEANTTAAVETTAAETTTDWITTTSSKTTTTATTTAKSVSDITIPETVLFDEYGIKVTAIEYIVDEIWGPEIKVLIENNSDKEIGVSGDNIIINNYMMYCGLSETVSAGKKSNTMLRISEEELGKAGITSIGEIIVKFHIYDPETYHTVYESDEVAIKTSAFDSMKITPQDNGMEIYNADGIRIVAKYVTENGLWGSGVALYLENTSTSDVLIQCDDVSVNGFMVSSSMSCNVNAGRMAMDEITIYQSSLDDNGITAIEEVEWVFKVINPDTYDTIYESEPITISATE